MVSTRAAHLCACGIASLLKRVLSLKLAVKDEKGECPEMTVGVFYYLSKNKFETYSQVLTVLFSVFIQILRNC